MRKQDLQLKFNENQYGEQYLFVTTGMTGDLNINTHPSFLLLETWWTVDLTGVYLIIMCSFIEKLQVDVW